VEHVLLHPRGQARGHGVAVRQVGVAVALPCAAPHLAVGIGQQGIDVALGYGERPRVRLAAARWGKGQVGVR